MIASRDKKSPQASGRGGIIAKAEALLEKVEKILSEIVERSRMKRELEKPLEIPPLNDTKEPRQH